MGPPTNPTTAPPQRVWYLAYGSNLNRARFLRYLTGDDTHAGARDPSPPIDDRWVKLPFRLHFARSSTRWSGGGVAFVHPGAADEYAWFRGWQITGEQFEDVFAQENRLGVGHQLDWDQLRSAAQLDVGNGWYRRLLAINAGWAEPAFTFTASEPASTNAPHESYRDTIASGLADNSALASTDIAAYLDAATAAENATNDLH